MFWLNLIEKHFLFKKLLKKFIFYSTKSQNFIHQLFRYFIRLVPYLSQSIFYNRFCTQWQLGCIPWALKIEFWINLKCGGSNWFVGIGYVGFWVAPQVCPPPLPQQEKILLVLNRHFVGKNRSLSCGYELFYTFGGRDGTLKYTTKKI